MLDFYSYYLQPNCHKIGLTLEQFWYDDPQLYFEYLEAYNNSEKARLKELNFTAFLQGQYTLHALAQVLQFSKTPKQIYPKEPFDLGLEEKKVLTLDEENDKMLNFFKAVLK